ncbi:heme exporter protein CcmD [Variovorax sp. M-6]
MNSNDPVFFLLAAYGVTLALIAAEVWALVRRGRAQARPPSPRPRDEA